MVCASEGGDPNDTNHTPLRAMTNTELTLDQLQSMSGAGTETHWKTPSYNLKELSKSGALVPFKVVIPDPMYFPAYRK